jgi:hypothetical protein
MMRIADGEFILIALMFRLLMRSGRDHAGGRLQQT